MKKFIVNEHLSLRLEEKKTHIYVSGKKFRQCMFLLLEIPIKEISSLNEITSIDEASELLERSEESDNASELLLDENGSQRISPDVEFWGHCSNLQVWYENDYDTRLIHRNLAFPLLRELADAGDPLAKRVFGEEVAKRLESGYLPVVSYLFLEHYTYYLSEDYFGAVAHSQKMIDILFKAVESKDSVFKFVSLYLFHRLYSYLNDEIVQKFVDFVKQDGKYVKKIFYEPALLTNAWVYFNSPQLFSIRVALILDDMKDQYDSKINYENLHWNLYLEDIIFKIIILKNSITFDHLRLENDIGSFLKSAYEKDGRLTKKTISNCMHHVAGENNYFEINKSHF